MEVADIISEVCEKYSEWIEMAEDPNALITQILAIKIIKLESYIEFLEKERQNGRNRDT